MKNIENEYKKRFGNQEMNNSDFDTEGLWQDIIGDLDNPPTPPLPPSGGGNLGGFLKYGLILIALIGVGLWYVLPVNQSTEMTSASSSASAKRTQTIDNQANTENKTTKNTGKLAATQNNSSNPESQTKQIEEQITRSQQESLAQNNTQPKTTAINTPNIASNKRINNIKVKQNAETLASSVIDNSQKPTNSNISIKNKMTTVTLSQTENLEKYKADFNKSRITPTNSEHNKSITLEESNAPNKQDLANNSRPANAQKINEAKTITITNKEKSKSSPEQSNSLVPSKKEAATTNSSGEESNEATTDLATPSEETAIPKTETDEAATDLAEHPEEDNADINTANQATNDEPKLKETLAQEEKEQQEEKRINLPKLRNITWEVGLHGGASKMNLNFQSTKDAELAALRNKNESGDWGSDVGVDVRMIWKNKWSLNTGVSYQSLWSKLEYSKTQTQDSVLQIVEIDTAGNILGTTYGSETKTFKTLWHNQYTTYRIPLTIGYQQRSGKWLYGANLGAIFNITTLQKGRSFDNESKISFFTKDDAHAPLKAFQIGFRASPFVGYALSDKWVLRLTPSWNSYQGNTGRVSDFNFNIGLGFRF